MERKILILDTTLRDGEQVPGAKLNKAEKLEIAQQLNNLNVDYIEAGFPSSSAGDFKSVEEIAKNFNKEGPVIVGLARAVKDDIDAVYNSIKHAKNPLIHIVLGTSNIHIKKKFDKSKEQILKIGVEAVRYAKSLLPKVQYSTEDASRSDFEYLWQTIEAVINAGATIINIPDTVGYAVPEEFGELIKKINYRIKNLEENVILSVHCHNDMGMATANTLAAVKNGAEKVECTVNGIGERAGNAALEEVVMAMKARSDYYKSKTNIVTSEIKKTSKLVSNLMGLDIQVNKAITGENAFAHSSGIHQAGLLKSKDVYEVIKPEDVGADETEMILTARSGKHALRDALLKMGFSVLKDSVFIKIHKKFLELADKKKEVYLHDLYFIVKEYYDQKDSFSSVFKPYELLDFQAISNNVFSSATVKVKKGDNIIEASAHGDGPVDALYTALKSIVQMDIKLTEYKINSISQGKEALGRANIKIEHKGKSYFARAVDTDIIKASGIAFLNAINRIILEENIS